MSLDHDLSHPHGIIDVQIACTKRLRNVEGFEWRKWSSLAEPDQRMTADCRSGSSTVRSMSLMTHDTEIIEALLTGLIFYNWVMRRLYARLFSRGLKTWPSFGFASIDRQRDDWIQLMVLVIIVG